MVEEIKEMLIALKNNWTIDFAKMEELCDYCLTTINQLQTYKEREDKLKNYISKNVFVSQELIHKENTENGFIIEVKPNLFKILTSNEEFIKTILQTLNEGDE